MGTTHVSGPTFIFDEATPIGVTTIAGVPVDGTSGTGAGVLGKGSLALDTTNGKIYVNGGTLASPTWKLVTSAA